MEAKIFKTINQVMQKISAIAKGRKNSTQNFVYRGIDDVMNELHPVMAECGLFVVPTVLDENRTECKSRSGGVMFYQRLKIKFTFYADDGSNVEAVVIGEAMDSGDKASNKALSIGLKYACLQVFCIPTEDDKDPDAQSPEMTQPEMINTELKGGDSTPEERREMGDLLKVKYADGTPVVSAPEVKKYAGMRKTKTAREVINELHKVVEDRLKREKSNLAEEAIKPEATAAQTFDNMKPIEGARFDIF